jgi:hypothetical protein
VYSLQKMNARIDTHTLGTGTESQRLSKNANHKNSACARSHVLDTAVSVRSRLFGTSACAVHTVRGWKCAVCTMSVGKRCVCVRPCTHAGTPCTCCTWSTQLPAFIYCKLYTLALKVYFLCSVRYRLCEFPRNVNPRIVLAQAVCKRLCRSTVCTKVSLNDFPELTRFFGNINVHYLARLLKIYILRNNF